MHFPEAWHSPKWRDNTPFEARLALAGMRRGRSAAYFMFTDEDGHEYPMFMSDLETLLCSPGGVAGGITGGQSCPRWVVQKRGQNYGIRLATRADG
jgi:hypothetical protein